MKNVWGRVSLKFAGTVKNFKSPVLRGRRGGGGAVTRLELEQERSYTLKLIRWLKKNVLITVLKDVGQRKSAHSMKVYILDPHRRRRISLRPTRKWLTFFIRSKSWKMWKDVLWYKVHPDVTRKLLTSWMNFPFCRREEINLTSWGKSFIFPASFYFKISMSK